MQFRQLRYFVKIVEAGSFSRAAATIHVAQPALSQQIAELEERLGVKLLQRSARGVTPTAAGEVLLREASAILHQLDQLPGIVRSGSDQPEGAVSLGLAISLASTLIGPLVMGAQTSLPKVKLKLSDADSRSLEQGIAANHLDMAVVYEDELVSAFSRRPIFRQRMYLIGSEPTFKNGAPVSIDDVAKLPLVLPSLPNGRRSLIDRAFAERGFLPNIVAEAETLSSELSAVRSGVAHTILPVANPERFISDGFVEPVMIEPGLFLTCSVISSSDFPLSHAGEAVRRLVTEFLEKELRKMGLMGVEWLA
jgi:LysR family transcriptional regulator, nitrogen assimilation regulatory protein